MAAWLRGSRPTHLSFRGTAKEGQKKGARGTRYHMAEDGPGRGPTWPSPKAGEIIPARDWWDPGPPLKNAGDHRWPRTRLCGSQRSPPTTMKKEIVWPTSSSYPNDGDDDDDRGPLIRVPSFYRLLFFPKRPNRIPSRAVWNSARTPSYKTTINLTKRAAARFLHACNNGCTSRAGCELHGEQTRCSKTDGG